jgi:hypothetical protein
MRCSWCVYSLKAFVGMLIVMQNLVVQLDDPTSYCRCRRTSQHWERCGC